MDSDIEFKNHRIEFQIRIGVPLYVLSKGDNILNYRFFIMFVFWYWSVNPLRNTMNLFIFLFGEEMIFPLLIFTVSRSKIIVSLYNIVGFFFESRDTILFY